MAPELYYTCSEDLKKKKLCSVLKWPWTGKYPHKRAPLFISCLYFLTLGEGRKVLFMLRSGPAPHSGHQEVIMLIPCVSPVQYALLSLASGVKCWRGAEGTLSSLRASRGRDAYFRAADVPNPHSGASLLYIRLVQGRECVMLRPGRRGGLLC